MQAYMPEHEILPGEVLLRAIPYKPFSVLLITNRRIVGRRLWRLGPARFEGSIAWSDIMAVDLNPGIPLLTTPKLIVHYRKKDGATDKVAIRLPGFTAKLAGFDPRTTYELILRQIPPQASESHQRA